MIHLQDYIFSLLSLNTHWLITVAKKNQSVLQEILCFKVPLLSNVTINILRSDFTRNRSVIWQELVCRTTAPPSLSLGASESLPCHSSPALDVFPSLQTAHCSRGLVQLGRFTLYWLNFQMGELKEEGTRGRQRCPVNVGIRHTKALAFTKSHVAEQRLCQGHQQSRVHKQDQHDGKIL